MKTANICIAIFLCMIAFIYTVIGESEAYQVQKITRAKHLEDSLRDQDRQDSVNAIKIRNYFKNDRPEDSKTKLMDAIATGSKLTKGDGG